MQVLKQNLYQTILKSQEGFTQGTNRRQESVGLALWQAS